jgi:outer membrane immunogenic protein
MESLGHGDVMKRIFLGTVAVAAFLMGPQAASAADVTVPILFNYWSGAYAGLQGGWGWTSTKGLNASGVLGGGQVGYNYQIGNFVLGLEGDGAFANISQNATNVFVGIPAEVGYRDDGLASLRGRFGIASQNVLFYGTFGGGWGHDRISTTSALDVMASATAWRTGWSAGGGIEYGFLPTWSVKLEYLHYGLGSANYFGVLNTGNVDVETVKIGVNYMFR